MKQLLRNLPFYKNIRSIFLSNNYVILKNWKKIGRPIPPPPQYKQLIVKQYKKKYDLKVLIETGTYMGDMVYACRKLFRNIYSIELNNELASTAKNRFRKLKKIEILQGDSSAVLPTLLERINDPTLFWLDGHYSAGITSKADLNTPIVNELNCISKHAIKKHVVLIDDARCFIGKDDYPTLEEIKRLIVDTFPYSTIDIKDDIIRIEPK